MAAFATKYGRWMFLGGASAAIVVAKCSSKFDASSQADGCIIDRPMNVRPPDFAPSSVWNENWDRADPRFLKNKVWGSGGSKSDDNLKFPTAKRNIILIRHGQYSQEGDRDECHTLTKLGEEQAALVGTRLTNSGIKFTSIISSGMTRAIQTAEIMLTQMKSDFPCLSLDIKDPILNEGPPCIPTPPYRNCDLWDPDFNEFYAEGARIEAAFRKYFHRADLDQKEDSYEIIVCHANVIRYFTMRAMQFPPEAWLRVSLEHSSMTRITLHPNGDVILRGLGDSGHLPASKVSA